MRVGGLDTQTGDSMHRRAIRGNFQHIGEIKANQDISMMLVLCVQANQRFQFFEDVKLNYDAASYCSS